MARNAASKSNGRFSTLCERSSICMNWAARWAASNCSAEACSHSAAIGLRSGNASTSSPSCLAFVYPPVLDDQVLALGESELAQFGQKDRIARSKERVLRLGT